MTAAESTPPGCPPEPELRAWLAERVAEVAGLPAGEVDAETPFAEYGLDSTDAVGLAGELEERLGCELDETLLWEYPNIRTLARHLCHVASFPER